MKKKNFCVVIGMVMAITAVVLAVLSAFGPPEALSDDAPADRFSASRALKHLRAISQEPHPMGTAAHTRMRQYIITELKRLGLEPEIQETTAIERFFFANVKNVIVHIPGTMNQRPVLLLAHYDTVSASPGAGDDGIGVATLLETIRAIHAGPPLRHDLIMLFSDGEEDGLRGALAFVKEHPLSGKKGIVLNFEGESGGPSILIETSGRNSGLLRSVSRFLSQPRGFSLASDLFHRLQGNRTDIFLFLEKGWQGLNFVVCGDLKHYHTQGDNLQHFAAHSLQHHGDNALALARGLANETPVGTDGGDAVFFNLFGSWLVRYPQHWALPLALLGLILFLLLILWGMGKGMLSPLQISKSLALFIAGLPLIFAFGLGLRALIGVLHGSVLPAGNPTFNPFYFLSFVFITLGIVASAYQWLRRRLGWLNLYASALATWFAAAITISALLPSSSYLLFWPAMTGLIGLGYALLSRDKADFTFKKASLYLVCALPTLLLVPPHFLMLFWTQDFMGISFFVPAIVSFITMLLAISWLALLEVMARLQKKLMPILAGVAAAVMLILGGLTARYNSDNPRYCNIHYEMDIDAQKAYLLCPARQWGEWARRFMPQAKPGHPFIKEAADLHLYQPVPLARLAAPQLEVTQDKTDGNIRYLKLNIRPGAGIRQIIIHASGGQFQDAKLNGRPVFHKTSLMIYRVLVNFLLPPPLLELELTVNGGGGLEVSIQERLEGLPVTPGLVIPSRPPDIIPQRDGDQTIVYKKFKI